MIDVAEIFKNRLMNGEKLLGYGFAREGNAYKYTHTICGGDYLINVTVRGGSADYSVTDGLTGEEYALVKIPSAQGAFVGSMRGECEQILIDIANNAFDKDAFREEQTARIIAHIGEKYASPPEFLWDSSPDCAVFRHADNRKWFAIIMTVDKGKVVAGERGQAEVIGLRADADVVASLLDGVRYHRGYHMNKKYWYNIILDGQVPDSEIFDRIGDSFSSTIQGGSRKK